MVEDGAQRVVVSCELAGLTPDLECKRDADCADPSKPVCSSEGECVADTMPDLECKANADCADPSKPVCSSEGKCVADTMGEPGLACDVATYQSECLSENSYRFCNEGVLGIAVCGSKRTCKSRMTTGEDGTTSIVVSCELVDTTAPPECKANADCKDSSKPICSSEGKCVADTTAPPECKANADCKDSSKPICSEEGKCVADTTSGIDPCEGVVCEKGECDRGVCVTEEMKNVKGGDPCDDTFYEFCRGDEAVYCSTDNKVRTMDCAFNGGCTIAIEESEGGALASAWCRGDAERCTQPEQRISYCVSLGVYAYESALRCLKNTEGTFTAIDLRATGYFSTCEIDCNPGMTHCGYGTCTDETEVALECGLSDSGGKTVVQRKCKQQADGGLRYEYDTIQTCLGDCVDGKCTAMFEGEGKPCKSSEFVKHCATDKVVATCQRGYGRAVACEAEKCFESKDGSFVGCVDDTSVCDHPGSKKSVCLNSWYGGAKTEHVCIEMKDGSKRWVPVEESTVKCVLGCTDGDANGSSECVPVADNSGRNCTAEALQYCKNKGSESCAPIKDGGVNSIFCYSSGDVCKTPEVETYSCKDGIETKSICTLAEDGATKVNVATTKECVLGCGYSRCTSVSIWNGRCSTEALKYCENRYGSKYNDIACAVMGKNWCVIPEKIFAIRLVR